MQTDKQYFNFPIQLLGGFLENSRKTLDDIFHYAVYAHSLKLTEGTQLQRIQSSIKYFNVTCDISKTLKDGRLLHDSLPDNSPKAGLNLDIFWDYYKNDKTEFDKVCLLAFLAIKSILQNHSSAKITNQYLLSRMDGKSHSCKPDLLSAEVRKYFNEYQIKKIKIALRDGWKLVTYARYTRGFYVSFKMSLDDLIFEVEKRRKSTKEKQYRKKENDALAKALTRLNVQTA